MKLGYLLFALLGLAIGWGAAVAMRPAGAEMAAAADAQCPMHPWIKAAHGGHCTVCGMDLVPVSNGMASEAATSEVMLAPDSIRATGVRTAAVTRTALVRTLKFAGRFEEDMTGHGIVSAPVEGRIDGLGLVHGNGKITQRQPLANIFSRTLLAAAKDYKVALNHDEAATAVARQKLEHHGLVWEQIKSIPLRQDNDLYFGLLAQRTGTVVKSYVSEGQYVREGDRLFEIADLNRLWFMFPVFEQDLPLIQPGQPVKIETATNPPEHFKAVITSIGRHVDMTTHAVDVRVEMANPNGQLRLNGEGMCMIYLVTPDVLVVPRAAVLWPGAAARVYVETQPGVYAPRTVQLGRAGDNGWEVLAGLKQDEHVVTEAAVLVDGQAQLRAGT